MVELTDSEKLIKAKWELADVTHDRDRIIRRWQSALCRVHRLVNVLTELTQWCEANLDAETPRPDLSHVWAVLHDEDTP